MRFLIANTSNISSQVKDKYYKVIKLTASGEKIGYYNSDLDPEDSWPTKDVDLAQILTHEQAKSVKFISELRKQTFNLDYSIHIIEV